MASKSSAIKAIDRLVRDGLIVRTKDKFDKRRKILSLGKTFKPRFLAHLDEFVLNIIIDDLVEKAEVSTIWSAKTIKHLLLSLRDSPIPLMIHSEDGEILLISKTWERLTGYSHDEIPTIKIWTEKAYAHSDTVSEARDMILGLYKIEDAHFDGTTVVYTKSGKSRLWKFRSAPLGRHADGRANIITFASDVTDLRSALVRF